MSKIKLAIFLFLCSVTLGIAQTTLADFKYVAVPEQFEFVKGKDRYQVNSLSKFLFNKYGFDAYFTSELPNVTRCEVLWADVTGSSSFIYTKIRVILRDCNGVEVYRTQEGRSKDKEYKKAYHEAIREAFSSFENLNKADVEVVSSTSDESKDDAVNNQVIEEPVEVSTPVEAEKPMKKTVYRYADYRIEPSVEGKMKVFQGDQQIGVLTPSSQKDTFFVQTSVFNGIAYKNKRSIVVEYQAEGVNNLVEMKFVKNEE